MLYERLLRIWTTLGGYSRFDWMRFVGWLAVLASLLFGVISTRYVEFLHVQSAHAWIYFVFAYLGHLSLLALLLFLPLFLVSFLLPYRILIVPIAVALLFGGLAMLVLDTAVFRLYRFHLSGFVWELLTGPGANEVIVLSDYTRLVALGVLIVVFCIVCVMIGLAIICTRHHLVQGKGKYFFGVGLASWLISQGMHLWHEAHYDMEVAGINRVLPAYYPMTAKRRLLAMGLLDPDNVRPGFTPDSSATDTFLRYPLQPLICSPPAQPMNVLVIAIDSLRADMWTPDVMPRMSALSKTKGAQYFSNHSSGGNATKGGIFSLFYGLPANYWDDFAATATAPLWIRQHQAAQHEMAVFSSATLLSPAFDRTVFASIPDLRWHTAGNGAAERDLQTLKEFGEFLDSRVLQKPFFGFLFLDASHNYDVPEGYEKFQPQSGSVDHSRLDKSFDPTAFMNRYRNSLVFLDEQLGLLVEKMRKDSSLENTVLIVTSDHGEQFNDFGQNFWGHGSNFSRYQVHVPLLVIWPGRTSAVHDYATSHYDIAPTVIQDVFGCENAVVDYAVGGNLFDPTFPRPWVLVSSYYNYGIVLEDRIVETFPFGWFQVVSPSNRLLEDQTIGQELSLEVLEMLSRYRR